MHRDDVMELQRNEGVAILRSTTRLYVCMYVCVCETRFDFHLLVADKEIFFVKVVTRY